MATENVYILSVKQNGQWVEIPAIKGDKGDSGFTYTEVTIAVADWNSSTTCTKQVSGLTASDHIVVSPAPASMLAVINNTVFCSGQGNGTLTFTCTTTPSSVITFEVMYGI